MTVAAVVPALLAVAGCGPPTSRPSERRTAAVDPPADLACAPRDLALAWLTPAGRFDPMIRIPPGGTLFAVGDFNPQVGRMADGSWIASVSGPVPGSTWTRVLETDDERRVNVREIPSGKISRTIAHLPVERRWTRLLEQAELNERDDAVTLLAPAIDESTRKYRVILRRVDLATGKERRVELEGNWSTVFTGVVPGGPSGDSTLLVDTTRADGRTVQVARIDWQTRAISTVEFSLSPPTENGTAAERAVIDVATDGSKLVLVATDGRVRTFDVATLTLLDDSLSVPLRSANRGSYAVRTVSPIAVSARGEWFAHTTARDGRIVIADSGGVERGWLELPALVEEDGGPGPAMAITFLPDGLMVLTSTTLVRFGCHGVVAPPDPSTGELSMEVSTPSSVSYSGQARAHIEVRAPDRPVIRFAREETGTFGSWTPDLLLWGSHARSVGTHRIEVGADDGVRRTVVTREIIVTP